MSNKKGALGRGLSALLEDNSTDVTTTKAEGGAVVGSVSNILLEHIEANPFQPRTEFEEEALNELASSIKELGVIQPVTVRKLGFDKYQLISGERRFRASKLAGLTEVPAYVRVANDQTMLEMALVENIQREELNPIEVSISYKRLLEECKLTQEALSERVGKKRSTIANYIRLLKLPPEIQRALQNNELSMGHARALVNLPDDETQLAIYDQIVKNALSVRQVENIVRELGEGGSLKRKKGAATPAPLSYDMQRVRNSLKDMLETPVEVKANKTGKGQIVIKFKSEAELREMARKLGVE